MSSDAPLLLIVSSPSGAGKTTLTNRLLAREKGLVFSISHTTRKPRAGEVDGREYHFVDRPDFEKRINGGEFLEWAEVHGNLYGTAKSEIERARGARGLIFDVDYQGARQIKSADPAAVAVFILPPNMHVLLERLRGRASDDEATVMRRYNGAREEIRHYGAFDYLLVNEDVERASEQLIAIFRAEECRSRRLAPLAERLLAEDRRIDSSVPGSADHKLGPDGER
jgi:guanylate kinase